MTEEPKGPPKIDLEHILSDGGEDGAQEPAREVDDLQVVGMKPARSDSAPPSRQEPAELDDLRERHLRLRAEFDNFRKRVEREKADLSRAAEAELVRNLLPVLDSLERALVEEADKDASALREGLALIHRQAMEVLERAGLEPIQAVGQPFDPACHEAVERHSTDDVPHQTVMEELLKGYRYQGKLLRAAMVRVAHRPEEDAPGGIEENGDLRHR